MKVDWSQPGETIEDLVAVLLRRENPMATQIRPSQGDGGMDVRAPFPTGGVEIFQVKKFNSTLNASQLRQIKESYESLNEYRLEHGLDVRAWHLLMPLNPTKENLEWFDELTTDAPFPCDWRGRDYLDGLAAKFPDVVDYYLQDRADRLALVVGQMLDLLRLTPKSEGAGVVTPAQLVEQLHALEPLIDTDPHFRYGISLDPGMPDPKDLGTGFVAAMSSGMANGEGGVVTVKIYPRFAEALKYRPVPGTVTFNVEPGSATEQDLERFIKYGTSLQTPFGSVDLDIDLPGGLGGSFEGGAVRIGPALGVGSSESGRLRLVAVDPSGASVAEVLVDMQPPSTGLDRTGFQVTGTDTAQVFDIELLGDVSGNSLKFSLQQRDLAGRSPSELLDAVGFLSALRAPNTLVIAQPFGPVTGQRLDLGGAADWLDFQALDNFELMLETLAAIQAHTPTQIVVPPTEAIYATTMNAWLTAKQLLEGQVVSVNGFSATVCIRPDADVPTEPIAIAMESEFFVHIGEQRVDLGRQVTHTPIAEVVPGSVVPHDDHQDCTFRSVDGAAVTIRITQPPT